MKRFIGIVLSLLLCGAFPVAAEEKADTSNTVSTAEAQGWKTQLNADKQNVAEQKTEMKQSGQAAKLEEKDLHKQIRDALAAGDQEKAQALMAQLKATHQENVAGRKEDNKKLGEDRTQLQQDRKAAQGTQRSRRRKNS